MRHSKQEFNDYLIREQIKREGGLRMSTHRVDWYRQYTYAFMFTAIDLLSNGSATTSMAFDNSEDGYDVAMFEFAVTFLEPPIDGRTIDLWLIFAPDGVNFDDSTASYKCSIPVRATTEPQKCYAGAGEIEIEIPKRLFRVRLRNDTGMVLPPTGTTLKLIPGRIITP